MRSTKVLPYFEGIEEKIIEEIKTAKHSVLVAMAWFTSPEIKRALLEHKMRYPQVNVEIVLDDNYTNARYFYNTAGRFRDAGIIIHPEPERMMHHKFVVIDGMKTLMGSYNYSKNARTNLESMLVFEDEAFSAIYTRVFHAISNPEYVDEIIKLLWKYPDFARKLISMYYPFTTGEYSRYRSFLTSGDCYTYYNGYRDTLAYEPGYFFNPSLTHVDREFAEFKKPYNKKAILTWRHSVAELEIIDAYREYPEEWDKISDDLDEHDEWFKSYYKRLIESTHTTAEIETLIREHVDIVIEDRLWTDNFKLFMHKGHLPAIFESIAQYQADSVREF